MEKSKIFVSRYQGKAFVQVVGRGSFQNAGSLKRFYTGLLEQGVHEFMIDLRHCLALDSTFLGILTGLGMKLRHCQNGRKGRLVIVNADSRNLEVIRNLGLDRMYTIDLQDKKNSRGCNRSMNEVPCPSLSYRDRGKDMLEAHRNLMAIDPRNVPRFKDVVSYLKEDLGQVSSD